jgi:hypothetical protein
MEHSFAFRSLIHDKLIQRKQTSYSDLEKCFQPLAPLQHALNDPLLNIVAYRPIAKRRLCKQQRFAQFVGELSASRLGRFTPGERDPGTHWIGGWLDPRTDLDDVEKRKLLTIPGLEFWPLGRPVLIQLLYRLSYAGSYAIKISLKYKYSVFSTFLCVDI